MRNDYLRLMINNNIHKKDVIKIELKVAHNFSGCLNLICW
jgi:hypothetical protein